MSEWREFFESLRWRGVVLGVAGIAGFVALCFAPMGSCSLKVTSTPTTTTIDPYPDEAFLPIESSIVWYFDDETGEMRCIPPEVEPRACRGKEWQQ